MAEWYTCGTCRCADVGHSSAHCRCTLTPGVMITLMRAHPGCPRWLPPRGAWKTETCGTCDFHIDEFCRRIPQACGAGLIYAHARSGAGACAEWMPNASGGSDG